MVSSSSVAMSFSLTSGVRPDWMRVLEVVFYDILLLVVGSNGIWGLSILATLLVFCFAESCVNLLELNATSAFRSASAMCANIAKGSGDLRYE